MAVNNPGPGSTTDNDTLMPGFCLWTRRPSGECDCTGCYRPGRVPMRNAAEHVDSDSCPTTGKPMSTCPCTGCGRDRMGAPSARLAAGPGATFSSGEMTGRWRHIFRSNRGETRRICDEFKVPVEMCGCMSCREFRDDCFVKNLCIETLSPRQKCPCSRCFRPVKLGECADGSPVMTCPKPPLGVLPKSLCDVQRAAALGLAIGRYADAGFLPKAEWADELADLIRSIRAREADGAKPIP